MLTTIASSTSVLFNVWIDAMIMSLLSYAVLISMPGGRPGVISTIFCFTRSMTAFAFSPYRMTTIPPTTCPFPSFSMEPRRISPPSCTVPMLRMVTGTPFGPVPTTISSISLVDRI